MPLTIGTSAGHGFDQPLGLMQDCHRRVEHFLRGLVHVAQAALNGSLGDDERKVLDAARKYFATSGRHHTRDEEDSLFPRLRLLPGAQVAALVATAVALDADHRRAEVLHAKADALFDALVAAGTLSTVDAAVLNDTLAELSALYADHIAIEDRTLFPGAAAVLTPDALEEIGREMAARRGAPFVTPSPFVRRA
jgi:hemerythrin-like domain-containing protein